MRGVFVNLIGTRSGKILVVDGPVKIEGRRGFYWRCRCDCGKDIPKPIVSSSIIRQVTQSCGCLMIERVKRANTKHGKSKGREYVVWKQMWARTTKPSHKSYEAYKNFVPVDRWKSFENFYADMGDRPEGMSLDRIDNSKPYSPENCRWADAYTQQSNTKRNIYVEIDGEKMCLKAACRKTGMSYRAAKGRVKMGVSPYDAVTKPLNYSFNLTGWSKK